MALTAGARLGSYEILRPIGAGGMGEVYLARDPRLNRQVALKLLPPEVAADPDRRARFEREARAAAALSHPNICTIFEVGEVQDHLFIAMEFLDGATLADCLKAGPAPMAVAEVVDIAIQIADALDEARKQHIVHRDLKSANIILLPRGQVKILDFGLAKQVEPAPGDATTAAGATDAGMVIGTAAYMSPEQALGRPVDHRSDLFSFGIVLYELLTGRLPFAGRTGMELLNAIVNATPAAIPRFNEQVPDRLVQIVSKLLAKDPQARYQSAHDVLVDLKWLRDDGSGAVVTRGASLQSQPRLSRTAVVGGVIGAAILIGVAVTYFRSADHAPVSVSQARSVVALPTTVLGAQPEQWYTDAVPATLSKYLVALQSAGLETKAPPNSFEMAPLKNDLRKAAQAYGADLVIKTSIIVEPARLRLAVQLIEPEHLTLMKSWDFEGRPEAYLTLIEHAADGLRQVLRPAASPIAVPATQTTSSEAELAFGQGEHYWNRYNNLHESGDFDVALASLRHALELDSTMADAAAEIGFLYVFRIEAGFPESRLQVSQWADRAKDIAERSGKPSGMTWVLQSANEYFAERPNPEKMLRYALKAAFQAPRMAIAQIGVVNSSSPVALRLEGARKAHELDPLYVPGANSLAYLLFLSERSQEALSVVTDTDMRVPGAPLLMTSKIEQLASLGRTDEAQRAFGELRGQKLEASQLMMTEYQSRIPRGDPGARTLFDQILGRIERESDFHGCEGEDDVTPFVIQYDRLDAALRLLTLCRDKHDAIPSYDWLQTDSRLRPLRNDVRFAPLLEESRRRFVATMRIFDETRARGELPAFYAMPLADLHARFPDPLK